MLLRGQEEGGRSLCSQNRTSGSTGETPRRSRLQASPSPKELEEVIAIGVCNTSRQHGWEGGGEGRATASQNQILPRCQPHTLLLPQIPQTTLTLRY